MPSETVTDRTSVLRSVRWLDEDDGHGVLRVIDQRRLPGELVYANLSSADDVVEAIRTLAIRGANSIGAAGAFGYAFAVRDGLSDASAAALVSGARPTAVTLMHGVQAASRAYRDGGSWDDAVHAGKEILERDAEECRRIGEIGARELAHATTILTHCNTGILATAGIGTALGVIYTKKAAGDGVRVFSTETRPLRQGLRLTAWELRRQGVDVTSLVDGAAPAALRQGLIDAVIVGADRIAANGDTANKIGTYGIALAARASGVPFYVAAPLSAVDPTAPSGGDIPVEYRDGAEVLDAPGVDPTIPTWNPAFDVTPATLITGIITPVGVLRAPYETSIGNSLVDAGDSASEGER